MTESCHTPKRHHRKRFWLLVAAGVVVLIVCLPQVVLSLWGAPLLGQLLSQQLHTAVTLEEVRGGWWRGLELRHLTVAESPTPQAPLLMRMERMSLNLAFVPLLLSGKPVSARIDDVQINLRRRDDGQWNLAVLLARLTRPKQIEVSKPKTSKPFSLPDRRVDVALTGGRLSLGPDGATYTFDLQTGSPSLAQAPLQWQFALQGPEGAASTIRGQIQQLAGSELPEGHAEVDITDLDLDVITPLLRLDPAIQPQGVVRKAHLRFDRSVSANPVF